MQRIWTTLLILTLVAAPLRAQEEQPPPATRPAEALPAAPQPSVEPVPAAPHGAQPAGSAGYYYSPYGTPPGYDAVAGYFAATGGRIPNTWAGLWGYGNDCHLGAVRFEYLMWFSRGRNTPPLVTTSPQTVVDPNQAGVLGLADTDVVYGDQPIGENMRSGARITLSRLLADGGSWLEGRFWGVEDSTERFFAQSNGDPIGARPFFNAALGIEDALLVAFPGVATGGSVNVLSKNDMFAADAWVRGTWCDDCCTRLDFLLGYQFARIDDYLSINSTLTSIDPAAADPINTIVSATDAFGAQNQFHGVQLGFIVETRKDCWSLEILGKVGLGNMRQRVVIRGETVRDPPGAPPPDETTGGLLALPSNIGDEHRNEFAVVPELNINACVNLSPTWKLMAGYTFIYYSNVVLAGNQIDRAVNLSQVPGPPVGPLRPLFAFNRSDFLIQGMNLGVEYRW